MTIYIQSWCKGPFPIYMINGAPQLVLVVRNLTANLGDVREVS